MADNFYFSDGAHSFLHEANLLRLRQAGFIDDRMMELSKSLRQKALHLLQESWTAEAVRTDEKWHELFDLSEQIQKLNTHLQEKASK